MFLSTQRHWKFSLTAEVRSRVPFQRVENQYFFRVGGCAHDKFTNIRCRKFITLSYSTTIPSPSLLHYFSSHNVLLRSQCHTPYLISNSRARGRFRKYGCIMQPFNINRLAMIDSIFVPLVRKFHPFHPILISSTQSNCSMTSYAPYLPLSPSSHDLCYHFHDYNFSPSFCKVLLSIPTQALTLW